MARGVVDFAVANDNGDILPSVTCEVRDENGDLALIYSVAEGGLALQNPLTTGTDGIVRFYVDQGRYTMLVRDPVSLFERTLVDDVVAYDPLTDNEIVSQVNAGLGGTEWQGNPDVKSVSVTRTLAADDRMDILELDAGAVAMDLQLPSDAQAAIPVGTVVALVLINSTNECTVTASPGVTLNDISGGSCTFESFDFAMASVYKRGSNSWAVSGSISTVA